MSMPTFWMILRRRGLKAAINFKAERLCVYNFSNMHRHAKSKGHNLVSPDWKNPWWFKIVSKIEWWTR